MLCSKPVPAPESTHPFLFRQLLRLKEEQGFLTREQVAEYAVRFDCTARSVWRWISAGRLPTRERRGLILDDEVRAALYESRGNVTLASERLRKARGEHGLSRRNLCRVVLESLPADERAFLSRRREGTTERAPRTPHRGRRQQRGVGRRPQGALGLGHPARRR
jgi:hypothetical protein